MSRIDETIKLLERIKVLVINNYDSFICSTCKKNRNQAEFYKHELKRKTPVCKMCRQKTRLERKYKG